MAEIVYKPHCSKCGHLINTNKNEITYQEISIGSTAVSPAIKVDKIINPYKCSYCGAFFDCIKIVPPKKLQDVRTD